MRKFLILAALGLLWASGARACGYAQAFVLPQGSACYQSQAQAFSLGYAAPQVRVRAFAVPQAQAYAAPVVVQRQAFAYGPAVRQVVVQRQFVPLRQKVVVREAVAAPAVRVDVRAGLFGRRRVTIRAR